MFIEVLRNYIGSLPSGQAGLLAGLRDPLVGKVLSLVHGKSREDWTIDRLARETGVSRIDPRRALLRSYGNPTHALPRQMADANRCGAAQDKRGNHRERRPLGRL
jgi:transcriptional regulator GlxA family with amidase domain